MGRKLCVALVASLTMLALAAGAEGSAHGKRALKTVGATLVVDNDRKDCPTAGYIRIRDAVQHAHSGDTIRICAGTYAEGTGTPGSTVLTINNKNLTIRGDGADVVTIEPRHVGSNRIAETTPDIRNGKGVLIAILGQKTKPATVDISGVTVDANGVDATAGIVFRDAQGSVTRSHVTGLAIDESKNGYQVPGGFRSNNYGIGVAMVTRNKPPKNKPKVQPARTLTLDYTRIDHYNAVGLLVDGSTGTTCRRRRRRWSPRGSTTAAIVTNSQIIGRNSCQHYNDFTAAARPTGSRPAHRR